MRGWRTLVVLAVGGVLVAVMAGPALAKGPDQVTITGPGLSRPVVIGGAGEPGSTDRLGELTTDCGLFNAMFGPDAAGGPQMAAQQPTTALGPRYSLAWRVPTDMNTAATIHQDLYPWAAGGPLVYTQAGQKVFTDTQTLGGWYRAPGSLTTLLLGVGVPRHPAATAAPSASRSADTGVVTNTAAGQPAGHSSTMLIVTGALAVVILLAAGAFALRRHATHRVADPAGPLRDGV